MGTEPRPYSRSDRTIRSVAWGAILVILTFGGMVGVRSVMAHPSLRIGRFGVMVIRPAPANQSPRCGTGLPRSLGVVRMGALRIVLVRFPT